MSGTFEAACEATVLSGERFADALHAQPLLATGMRIGRGEFLRRLQQLEAEGQTVHAEWLEGVVTVMDTPDTESHGSPQGAAAMLLKLYEAYTPGVFAATAGGVILDEGELEPDVLLAIRPEFAGQMSRTADGKLTGPPELIVEIANTSVLRDTRVKRLAYERAGVREYLVHAVRDRQILCDRLVGERFEFVALDDGVFRSEIFPGLWIDCDALVAGDLPKAVATAEAGRARPEHAAFAQSLVAAEAAKKDADGGESALPASRVDG